MNTIPEWVSAATAVLALVLSIYATWSAHRSERETRRLQAKNVELSARQAAVTERAWTDAYFRDVASWGTNASRAISRAIHIAIDAAPNDTGVRSILAELSAAIDTGRWYFPNTFHEEFGRDKQPAYRGYRQPILTELVAAYRALSELRGAERRDALVSTQRFFVSEMQSVLDPREREEVISQVLNEFKDAALLRGLKSPQN